MLPAGSRRGSSFPRALLAAGAVLAVAAAVAAGAFPGRRARLFVGGPVLTMDAEGRVAEALAVDGRHVVAAGPRAELEAWAAAHGAEVIDLRGRAILPGFVDAHSHFPAGGVVQPYCLLASPPQGSIGDMATLVSTLKARAADSRSGDWIVGWGYDDTALAENRHPTRADLDQVSTENPVVAFHISMHVAAVNSKGLAALGLSKDSVDVEGGRMRRDADGMPDGVLEEEASRAALKAALLPSMIGGMIATREAASMYLAAGVTTAQNGAAQAEQLSGLAMMSRLGLLPLRLVVWPEGDTALGLVDGRIAAPATDPEWMRIGASKFVADGSIQTGTAHLRDPYYKLPPGGAAGPEGRGEARIPRPKLFEFVSRVHAAGGQVAVHGNGDAAIDDILDAFEAAQKENPRDDARPVIVHAQTARADQLDRMKALGVIPSFFEMHTWYWGDRHRDRFLGPARAAHISPLKSALDRDLHFTVHADTPVAPMEPMRMLDAAVTRRTPTGAVLGPEERIEVMPAIRALTIDAARQMFLEESVGSLEGGKLADFVVLDRSPLDDGVDLASIRVEETWVDGNLAFAADED